jgi:hypothetical protein
MGRRVRDVIADGDVLDHSLESLERSIVSGPRVINTLSSGTEGHGRVRMAFTDPCSCITRSQIELDPMAPVV